MTQDSKRLAPRVSLKQDLSDRLFVGHERTPLRCLGTDVSRNGLGIVCFENFAEGVEIIFSAKDKGVSLYVVWCKRDPVRANIFHIGLQTNDPAYNLVKMFDDAGLLPKDIQGNGSEKSREADGPPIGFETIKTAIALANSNDPKIFQSAGLGQLAKTHRAFRIRHNDISLVVLLPKDLKPSDAAKLSEDDAKSKVNIFRWITLQGENQRLKRIWPNKTMSDQGDS